MNRIIVKNVLIGVLLMTAFTQNVRSQNPIIQTIYSADPAAMVYKDTVYLYVGHDEDSSSYFTMRDWHIYSSTDMVNWTDKGMGLSLKDFAWAKKDAWAGQCIERNGKFYWYVPMNQANGKGMAIGVAVADHPTGPFKDALGKMLVTTGWGDIDPTVFIDDDGQAYLYWGNPTLYYVKLNKDMVSYDRQVGVVQVPLTAQGFKLRVKDANKTFGWADKVYGEQSQCYKDPGSKKFYWYVVVRDKQTGKKVIGVATGSRQEGRYTDMIGKPLVVLPDDNDGHLLTDSVNIHPTITLDEEKSPYLSWGQNKIRTVRLNKDMMSYASVPGIQVVTGKRAALFERQIQDSRFSNGKRISTYEEGPWLYKRNSRYYLIYPAGGVPEHIAYSTAKHATGPWHYQDTIMPVIAHEGAFTNHPSIIDYKGKSFFFYHDGALPGGGGFDRSVCVEGFDYNPDGTIPRIASTRQGVLQSLDPLNPYIRQEAETIAWEKGMETATSEKTGVYVTDIKEGSFIKVRSVRFDKGVRNFTASLAAVHGGGSLEIYSDSLSGKLLGSLIIQKTGGAGKWKTQHCSIQSLSGVHDLYFVFKSVSGKKLAFDWWQFK